MRRNSILILLSLNLTLVVNSQEYIDVVINYNKTDLVSSFHAGVTHTQYSIDGGNNINAMNDAKNLLKQATYYQNQHIMGWGALSPWEDSTVTDSRNWNWRSLDNRINLIRETNGKAIITLCGSPTWMYSPQQNGTTDWASIEKAPTPVHFDDFAHLCAVVARRYPDVTYFQVWNELKGFWNTTLNRWRYEDYTVMYNLIYDSLKSVNPNIQVGGPYPVIITYSVQNYFTSPVGGIYGYFDQRILDVLTYWFAHKKGADFISIDGSNSNKDDVINCDIFKVRFKFSDIVSWIRKQPGGGGSLDIWWSEWYASPGSKDPQNNQSFDNALLASSLIETIKAGSSSILLWQPEGDINGFALPLGLWTSTRNTGGGQPTPLFYTLKYLNDNFSKGTEIVNSLALSDDINVLASKDKVLLVNQKNLTVNVRINNSYSVILGPYEVKLVNEVITGVPVITNQYLKVFYDSSTGHLSINNLNIIPLKIKYRIFNLKGNVIIDSSTNVASDYQIDLNNYPPGIYFYQIIYSTGSSKGSFSK